MQDTYGRPHPLIYLLDQGVQFIFIRKDTKAAAHKWRAGDLTYRPTVGDINNYLENKNVLLPRPSDQEDRAWKAEHLSIAFVPASANLLAIDVDAPEYIHQIQSSVGQPITGVSTPSGGYHLFYKLPPEIADVYAKPYSLPDVPFSIGELRVGGYCLIYDPHAIAYVTQEAGRPEVPTPPLDRWPLDTLLRTSERRPDAPASRDYSTNTDPQDEETAVMLSYIQSDSYEDFFRILMALKAGQTSGELRDAYSLAQEWVNSGLVPNGRKMTAQEGLEHIWRTQPDGSSSMATITYLANESGYIPSGFQGELGVDIVVPEGGAAAAVQSYLNGGNQEASSPATHTTANPSVGVGPTDESGDVGDVPVEGVISVPDSAAKPQNPAPPPGRPSQGRPTRRTGNNLRNLARTLFFNKALESNLPKELRFDDSHLVECDVERILEYCSDQLFKIGHQICISSRQLWRLMSALDPISHALVRDLTMNARQEAYSRLPADFYDDETGESGYGDQLIDSVMDARHIDMVLKTLRNMINDPRLKEVKSTQVNDRDKYPILPFMDGTSLNLRTKEILSSEQVRPLLMLDHDWLIQRPRTLPDLLDGAIDEIDRNNIQHDWDITQAHLNGRYCNVIDRLSMYACGTTKSVDVINFPTDGGKSALIDALNRTFGDDAFVAVTAKKALGPNNRFATLPWHLANAMGVFVIELHGKEIDSADMNVWVETTQEFEKKGIDIKRGRRIGTVMIAGDEEPINFSSDSQGWKTRIKWVENRLEESPMSGADYKSMTSEAGTHCLLNHFIECAYRRFQQPENDGEQWKIRATQERERSEGVTWLQSEARDPIILALLEIIKPASSLDFVSTSDIVKVLKAFAKKSEDFGLDSKKIPTTRQINRPFKQAFPKIEQTARAPKTIQKKIEGTPVRGYEYFAFTPAGAMLRQDLSD